MRNTLSWPKLNIVNHTLKNIKMTRENCGIRLIARLVLRKNKTLSVNKLKGCDGQNYNYVANNFTGYFSNTAEC